MTTTVRWVRTNRRAPGSPWTGALQHHTPGPWHIERDHGLTWCGKRPGRLTSSQQTTLPAGVKPDGRGCGACATAMVDNRPKPYRRRR